MHTHHEGSDSSPDSAAAFPKVGLSGQSAHLALVEHLLDRYSSPKNTYLLCKIHLHPDFGNLDQAIPSGSNASLTSGARDFLTQFMLNLIRKSDAETLVLAAGGQSAYAGADLVRALSGSPFDIIEVMPEAILSILKNIDSTQTGLQIVTVSDTAELSLATQCALNTLVAAPFKG